MSIPAPHPDGRLGQIAGSGYAEYLSVTTSGKVVATDAQRILLGLDYVPTYRLTLLTRFELFRHVGTRYELTGGFKFYFKSPRSAAAAVNADGPVGGLVVSASAGPRFSDKSGYPARLVADFAVAMPLTPRLTLSAGYRYYEKMEASDAARVSADIACHFASYAPDSAYANPDGPVGYPVMRLSGAASENGFLVRAAVLFPIEGGLTLRAAVGVERIRVPYERSLTAGAGVVFYSGN